MPDIIADGLQVHPAPLGHIAPGLLTHHDFIVATG